MSGIYGPQRFSPSLLYVACAIIATVLVLGALRLTFGIDVTGGMVDAVAAVSGDLARHAEAWKGLWPEP